MTTLPCHVGSGCGECWFTALFFTRPPVPIGFACTACFVYVSKAHLLTRMKRVYGQSRHDRDHHDASIKTCTITPLSSSSATCSKSKLAVIHPHMSSWMGAMPSRYQHSNRVPLPQTNVLPSEPSGGTEAGRFRRRQPRWPRKPVEKPDRSIVAMGALKLWCIFLVAGDTSSAQLEYKNMLVQPLTTFSSGQLKIGATAWGKWQEWCRSCNLQDAGGALKLSLFLPYLQRTGSSTLPLRTWRGLRLLENHLGIRFECVATAVAPWRREAPDYVPAQKSTIDNT